MHSNVTSKKCKWLHFSWATLYNRVGRCAAELLRIFNFQNGGRPPSWIWYGIKADHPRLVFDNPNILLKFRVDRINILRDIAIFFIWPVWLEIAYSRPFLGSFGDMTGFPLELGTGARGQN